MARGEIVVHDAGAAFSVPGLRAQAAQLTPSEIVASLRKPPSNLVNADASGIHAVAFAVTFRFAPRCGLFISSVICAPLTLGCARRNTST